MDAVDHSITLRDGARLCARIAGRGQPVVLISGLGGLASFWDPAIASLGPEFQTVSFDQRGLGASERGEEETTIATLAEDTWELIGALGLPSPVLCGHSTGGAIAQDMALMRLGGSSRLVLSGTWCGPNRHMARVFEERLSLLATSPTEYPEKVARLGYPDSWLRDHQDILEAARANAPDEQTVPVVRERIHALLAHDRRAEVADISVPVLVTGARDDRIVPVALQEELDSALPDATLKIFEDGGHFYPITRASDFASSLRDWLA